MIMNRDGNYVRTTNDNNLNLALFLQLPPLPCLPAYAITVWRVHLATLALVFLLRLPRPNLKLCYNPRSPTYGSSQTLILHL